MSYAELLVDTNEPEGEDIMYLLPSKLSSSRYLASNAFDQATIKNCPVEKITSGGLIGIFASLKPLAKINIIVYQPIAVMLAYDSKQIEANLKLAGFEDIKINDINIKDDKRGKMIQTQSIEATKPESKRNVNINIQVLKTKYKDNKPYKKDNYDEPLKNRYNVTTKTTTTTETYNYGNRPKNNTYVREVREEVPVQEKKSYSRKRFEFSENNDFERPKNRTYVRQEENTTNDGRGGRGYYKRKMKYTSSTNEN